MRPLYNFVLIFLLSITATGCEVIGDIFSAGFYTGLFVVILILAIIIFIVAKISRK